MADLTKLLESLEDEAKAKQAAVRAAETRLEALRSAHADTLVQVGDAQDQIKVHQRAITEARQSSAKLLKDAQERASAIIAEADRARRQADLLLLQAHDRAAKLLSDAQLKVSDIERQTVTKRNELQNARDAVTAAEAQLEAIKRQAREFGGA